MLQLILFASCLYHSVSLLQKEITLNAQTHSKNGVSIHHNNQTVTISNTSYNIKVSVQEQDYDLKLSSNNEWSFHSLIESTITLTLFGHTPNPSIDTDLLLVFSVNNLQYFSFFIHLDHTRNIKSRIYSSLSLSNITRTVSAWISDNTIHSRWDRVSNNDQWIIPSKWNQQSIWPLKFITINNPIKNQIIFQFYHNNSEQHVFQYTFNDVFVANAPIDIYIMGDSDNEQFTVSSINMQLSFNDTTSPTSVPTFMPTILPGNYPSQIPTQYPTKIPTINPTFTTIEPTLNQSLPTIRYR
eukprot:75794_1